MPVGYFLLVISVRITGREPEVRASKEPSENAYLFAVFRGDAAKQGFSLEKPLPSKIHRIKPVRAIFVFEALSKTLWRQ
jgi:hypothetical protein